MSRVSTATLYNSPMASAMNAQSRYADATVQESSGLVSTTYGGYGSTAGQMLNLEGELTAAQGYASQATSMGNKVQSMYSAVGNMLTILTTLQSNLSSAISGSATSGTTTSLLDSEGSTALSDLVSEMNTKYGDEYVFSGSATDTAPVSLTGYAPTVATADTSYYQGDTTVANVRVSDQQKVAYGVTADNSAFEQALRAAYVTSTASASDTTTLSSAYDLVASAIKSLTTLQAQVSQSASALSDAASRQESFATLLSNSVSDVKNVNTASVALKVSEYQTLLSASYDAVAKIAKLSLTSYL